MCIRSTPTYTCWQFETNARPRTYEPDFHVYNNDGMAFPPFLIESRHLNLK